MRFRIINKNSPNHENEKQEDKDTETRQSSGNKFPKPSSFRDMVKNSYEFYLSLGKEKIKSEQEKVANEKQEKLKKLIKMQKITEQRREIKQLEEKAINKKQNLQKKVPKQRKQKPIAKPSRKSQRVKAPVSYNQISHPIFDQQIFDVLNIQSDDNSYNQTNQYEAQQKNQYEKANKKEAIIQKIQKLKQELIFEEQGTYEIGIIHESLLRIQKFIDQHINFKHEIRQCKSIELGSLIKYVKNHGFASFDESKFNLLIKINPYLYSFTDGPDNSSYLMTFKLNGLEIDKRIESTRRKMTQVSIPELFT